jgi:hypothetical protein
MKHFVAAGRVCLPRSGEHGKCRATKQQETNSYEQNKTIRAIERQRQCRAR